MKHLPERYHGRDILVTKNGAWHMDGLERQPERILRHVDVVFNAMHGEYGEDGTVQKMLEHFQLPYTGSASIPSAIGMNKLLSKKAFARHGIRTPRHLEVNKHVDMLEFMRFLFHNFHLPAIVKPSIGGSSVGVTLVHDYKQIPDALAKAFEYSSIAILEEYIRGREATCGVLEGFRDHALYSLPPVEIIPPKENKFFDLEAKYGGKTQEICPGNFSREEIAELQTLAVKAHQALGLRHYSRTDFIIHPKGRIYALEVNTLPGLTTESLYPKSLQAIGCDFPNFLDHLIQLALMRK